MDTPGDRRTPLTRVRVAALAITTVVAVLLVGQAVRAAGEPNAVAADTIAPVPISSASPVEPLPSSPAPSTAPWLPPAQDVLVLGDSLALSTYAWLADLMPDRYVSWEAEVGRRTPEARQALEALASSGALPPVIVVSSGTNDAASGSIRVEAARILAIAGPRRCVVWADVVRPDAFGDGLAAANDALAETLDGHPNVVPVAWTAIVAEHPDWMSSDGIHPVQAGNEARARALADAVFSCSPFDPDAPVAAQVYLPPSAFLTPGGREVPGVGPSATPGSSPKSASPSQSGSASPTWSASPTASDPEPSPTNDGSGPSATPDPTQPPDPTPTPEGTSTGAAQP